MSWNLSAYQYKFNIYIPEDTSNKMNIPKQINTEGSQI